MCLSNYRHENVISMCMPIVYVCVCVCVCVCVSSSESEAKAPAAVVLVDRQMVDVMAVINLRGQMPTEHPYVATFVYSHLVLSTV